MHGRIIVLNGVSSTGKTTLAKVLQDAAPFPLYRLDIDDFLAMSPTKYNDEKENLFPAQFRFAQKFFDVVQLYSKKGFDLVVPCMFFRDSEQTEHFAELLHGFPVLLVNVTCTVDELRHREVERGDRAVGSAEGQLVFWDETLPCDLVVNTATSLMEDCAELILQQLQMAREENAVDAIWQRFNK